MTKCQNCGNMNTAESNFCRFCGTRFHLGRPQPAPTPPPLRTGPPQPYSWKTDEFSTKTEARSTIGDLDRIGSYGRETGQQQLAQRPDAEFSQPYRCPHCMSQFLPRIERRISTAGWITFAALLVFFFPLFWIGLLVKEEVHLCPSCGMRVN